MSNINNYEHIGFVEKEYLKKYPFLEFTKKGHIIYLFGTPCYNASKHNMTRDIISGAIEKIMKVYCYKTPKIIDK